MPMMVRGALRFLTRRTVWIPAAGVVMIGMVTVFVLLWAHQPVPGSAQPGPGPTSTSSARLSDRAAQAHDVAAALSRLTTDPDSLVASSSRQQVRGRARDAVPAGSTVRVDEASWAPDGASGGVITVAVDSPGLPAVTYAAVMVLESGQWKVIATVPVADSTPAPSTGPTR